MMTLPPAGSIGLVKIGGPVGDAIHAVELLDDDGRTESEYQHAFVLLPGAAAGAINTPIVEAEPGGVREARLTEYVGRSVLWIPCPPEYSAQVVSAAMAYIGVPYAFADYAAIAAHHLGVDPLHLGEDFVKKTGHEICSMLCVACAQKAGWPLVPQNLWAGYVDPAQLAHYAPAGAVPELITA